MSQLRQCNICKQVFPTDQEGSATGQLSVMVRVNGALGSQTEGIDVCAACRQPETVQARAIQSKVVKELNAEFPTAE